MDTYFVIKGTDDVLGPFTIDEIAEFVKSGLVLKRDSAANVKNINNIFTVHELLNSYGKKIYVENKGGLFAQLKDIGGNLIFPSNIFSKEPWKKDNRLFIMALIGLSVLAILSVAQLLTTYFLFYVVSLYFAVVWGIFFYYMFKTDQVKIGKTVLVFFSTQILLLLYALIGIYKINPFQEFYPSPNFFVGLSSCVVGIGFIEEFIKLIPVIVLLYLTNDVTSPKTAVFYGLMSGISFGVYEGVNYQLTSNFQILNIAPIEQGYVYSYIYNILRMTSTPFLHSIWCGIGAYFIGFSFLYPRYRISLSVLAILLPAVLHGTYDYFSFIKLPIIVELPVVLLSMVLLIVYLNIGYDFHSKFAD